MFSRFAKRLVCLILWLSVCLTTAAWADVVVPTLTARVTDLTGTLSASQRSALEGELQAIEARSTNQIAVLMVPSTKPETIEQYSIRVVEAWKLGQKGKDNGLLVIVAKDDHKVRVEVGYGLEGRSRACFDGKNHTPPIRDGLQAQLVRRCQRCQFREYPTGRRQR